MLIGTLHFALAMHFHIASAERHADANHLASPEAAAMVVVPYRPYEICLVKKSVRRGKDGLTYFNTASCDPQRKVAVEKYRLNCGQNPDGPIAYERKIEGQWIASTAHGFDEIDQIIRRVCGFPAGLPRKPPRPPV